MLLVVGISYQPFWCNQVCYQEGLILMYFQLAIEYIFRRLVAMARVSAAVLVLVLACSINFFQVAESAGLVYNYYAKTCPNAEKIIKDTVYKLYEKKGNIATSFIRFTFHDCFNVRN